MTHRPVSGFEPTGAAVTITDAVFCYGARVALDTSSVTIPAGSVTALIGPNGSGKSTLLNGIAGLVAPDSGTVTIKNVNGHPLKISYVLQATNVNPSLPVTVREVVTMGRYAEKGTLRRLSREDRHKINEVMEKVGISHLAKRHLPRLSGGQRQRVLLAQGLVQDHDILLLDEPATGLDMVTMQTITDTIRAEAEQGCTVVLTTHDLADAWGADHVVLLAGRVVTSGPPAEVLRDSFLIEAYGTALLNVDGTHLLLDDPHHDHTPVANPQERTISVETWNWLREELPKLLDAQAEYLLATRSDSPDRPGRQSTDQAQEVAE